VIAFLTGTFFYGFQTGTAQSSFLPTIPCSINTHQSPDPKLSNPIFNDGMLIKSGELIFGIIDKKSVGAEQGSLVHVVFCKKGPENTQQLFTGLWHVINYWLFHNGFSIGIGNTIVVQKPCPTS
jgi:DNA-directed RNA polymerase II subunit RPB1